MISATKYDLHSRRIEPKGEPRGRPVRAVVRTNSAGDREPFESVGEAMEAAYCCRTAIRRWLQDGKEHYGYVYAYADGLGPRKRRKGVSG